LTSKAKDNAPVIESTLDGVGEDVVVEGSGTALSPTQQVSCESFEILIMNPWDSYHFPTAADTIGNDLYLEEVNSPYSAASCS
jgi:hypothetical protein